MITDNVKSIEIFPSIFGKYDTFISYPSDLRNMLYPYRKKDNMEIIRIYDTKEKMQEIYDLCFKYDIRCQKYIS